MPLLALARNLFMPVPLVLLHLGGITLASAPVPCLTHVTTSELYGVNLTRHWREKALPMRTGVFVALVCAHRVSPDTRWMQHRSGRLVGLFGAVFSSSALAVACPFTMDKLTLPIRIGVNHRV